MNIQKENENQRIKYQNQMDCDKLKHSEDISKIRTKMK